MRDFTFQGQKGKIHKKTIVSKILFLDSVTLKKSKRSKKAKRKSSLYSKQNSKN